MTLEARLRYNRQTQSSLMDAILAHSDQPETREVMLQQYLALVAETAEIERQLLAA